MKLYKRTGTNTHYHEAFTTDDSVIEHWGLIGETGETKTHPLNLSLNEDDNIERVLRTARARGFVEIDDDDHNVLVIEYTVEDDRLAEDLKRRNDLWETLDEILAWTGLGHVEGGSVGSGTMELFCLVVDFEKAAAVIRRDLGGTRFADFARIYDDDED